MSDLPTKLLEEKLRRGRQAKLRFRSAVRDVIYNLSWIQEDISSDQEISDVTALSIKQAATRIAKKKQSTDRIDGRVTIKEKALLRKNVKYRTHEDKNILNKCIGGLKCFRIYPPAVQLELVGVTYFEYYGPGRVLIRQNDEGHALYFLLSGEVVVYKTLYDELSNKYEEVVVNRLKKGQMFGEIALLHNVRRTATCITSAPCELLVLKKEDFDRILKANLMQIWDEVKAAMLKLVYFQDWDKIFITECCILARLETYEPNEIIFGDKPAVKGMSTYTYFISEGTCSVVEHLFVEETIRRGIKYYKLIELSESFYPDIQSQADTKSSRIDHVMLDRTIDRIMNKSQISNIENPIKSLQTTSSADLPSGVSNALRQSLTAFDIESLLDSQLKIEDSQKVKQKLPPNVKLVFMQICALSEKATFIDNDLMKNRRVIALTPCKILCIPTYYLIQHNKGNVWSRVEHFLRKNMPTSKVVFEKYVSSKKWQGYRQKVLNVALSRKRFYNSTTIHDVPYTIRARCSQ